MFFPHTFNRPIHGDCHGTSINGNGNYDGTAMLAAKIVRVSNEIAEITLSNNDSTDKLQLLLLLCFVKSE